MRGRAPAPEQRSTVTQHFSAGKSRPREQVMEGRRTLNACAGENHQFTADT